MKLKALKPHYNENGVYILPPVQYVASETFGERLVKLGICESLEPEVKEKDLSHVIELEDKNAAPKKPRTKKRPARRRKTKK